MSVQSIKYDGCGSLEIINQLLLPQETVYEVIANTEDGWQAIRQMKIRGAPAIAVLGSLSLAVELGTKDFETINDLVDWVVAKLDYLVTARPTAVNMATARNDLTKFVKNLALSSKDPETMKYDVIHKIERMFQKDISDNKAISTNGAQDIIKNVKNKDIIVLTHCNTGSLATAGYGTALGVIRALWSTGLLKHVYCTETRPYNQGSRLTAYELVQDNIPATLIADSMASITFKDKKISVVVVGADRVAANGDTANKIGTYQLAISAKHHNVPFFIAAPTTSIDLTCKSGDEIIIEERAPEELTHIQGHHIAAPGINCWNPAFDVTPAELITGGIVTEVGVFKPSELKKELGKRLKDN